MRVFLDTNVLLDFMCQREPFYKDAYMIFVMATARRRLKLRGDVCLFQIM